MRQEHSRELCAALASLFIGLGAPITAVSAAEAGSVGFSSIDSRQVEDLLFRFDRNALPSGSSDAAFENGEMFRLSGTDMPPLIVAHPSNLTPIRMTLAAICGLIVEHSFGMPMGIAASHERPLANSALDSKVTDLAS